MREKCPNCGAEVVFIYDRESGELICPVCGAVVRVEEPELPRYKTSLKVSAELGTERKEDPAAGDVKLMKNFASQLSVPAVVEDEAERLIRKLRKTKKRPNDPIGVPLACLYIAMRLHGMPVTYREMSRLGLRGRTLNRVVAALSIRVPAPKPELFVEKYASALSLDERVVREALAILRRLQCRDPADCAVAALYIASGGKEEADRLARRAGVSAGAVKKLVKSARSLTEVR
jgi:transcription initiation factor TFIIIB Brf1 subunit/transcription initiation factor TFIIB